MSIVHSNSFILLRENIGIYCENHTKQASGLSVRACVLARACVRARSQMHVFVSLQHTRLPLDFS